MVEVPHPSVLMAPSSSPMQIAAGHIGSNLAATLNLSLTPMQSSDMLISMFILQMKAGSLQFKKFIQRKKRS
jgi:hypothetical protein